jgi:hypothetical protein
MPRCVGGLLDRVRVDAHAAAALVELDDEGREDPVFEREPLAGQVLVGGGRHAGGDEELLEDVPVVADDHALHAGPGVRDAGELEGGGDRALEGVFPVQGVDEVEYQVGAIDEEVGQEVGIAG